MRLVVVGGNELGVQVASALHREHDLTILDQDEGRATAFESFDVRFQRGNGADPDDLTEAGVAEADAFLACTRSDDLNVLACLAAKGLGAGRTLAVVSRQRYLDAFRREGAMTRVGMSIDRVLWPQRLLAKQIADIVRTPRAVDSTSFADDRIHLREYRLEGTDPFLGVPLADADVPRGALLAGVVRDDTFFVPSGTTVLREDDKAVFLGTRDSVRAVEARFAPRRTAQRVTVIGGGNVGFMVAQRLQGPQTRVTVIETDPARAEKLATLLPDTLVLQGDGTDLELMEQERLDDSDVVVAVTDDDGKNLLASLLAKQVGIPKVVTRVGRTRNRRLFERVGIDAPLTTRAAALQEVLNWLRLDEVDHLASIEDRAEIMEVTYPDRARVGRIRDLGAPRDGLIGAILHREKVVIPSGDTTLQHGDRLFIVTTPDNVGEVAAWLERHCADGS
ncbi:MAG: Trk system potassium transporter TrkA [Trueperaceae bacterium]|nr:Trk system potassium transporter TrkA [Trueperaceae bacterium]